VSRFYFSVRSPLEGSQVYTHEERIDDSGLSTPDTHMTDAPICGPAGRPPPSRDRVPTSRHRRAADLFRRRHPPSASPRLRRHRHGGEKLSRFPSRWSLWQSTAPPGRLGTRNAPARGPWTVRLHAHVLFPNSIGGLCQGLANATSTRRPRRASILYNDALPRSRMTRAPASLPMPVLPRGTWPPALKEAERSRLDNARLSHEVPTPMTARGPCHACRGPLVGVLADLTSRAFHIGASLPTSSNLLRY